MYLRGVLFVVVLLFGCTPPSAERQSIAIINAKDSLGNLRLISEVVDAFRQKDRNSIAEKIAYPLQREFPLPPIQNKQEMLRCFTDVFDDSLTAMILNSDLTRDWAEVGYRGIMLLDGVLWINYDGQIEALNYMSKVESRRKQAMIDSERSEIHPSLKKYLEPVLHMVTVDYQIRIDKMTDSTFRFASWKPDASMASKPDLIIDNGQQSWQGSGGNHSFTFRNGNYTYICGIQILGMEDIPGELTVLKNDQEVLVQPIKTLRYKHNSSY